MRKRRVLVEIADRSMQKHYDRRDARDNAQICFSRSCSLLRDDLDRQIIAQLTCVKAAVLAGLTLIHSNGQVEGQVTRIKLIKRMMFGRAGFELLRQRVLHAL